MILHVNLFQPLACHAIVHLSLYHYTNSLSMRLTQIESNGVCFCVATTKDFILRVKCSIFNQPHLHWNLFDLWWEFNIKSINVMKWIKLVRLEYYVLFFSIHFMYQFKRCHHMISFHFFYWIFSSFNPINLSLMWTKNRFQFFLLFLY